MKLDKKNLKKTFDMSLNTSKKLLGNDDPNFKKNPSPLPSCSFVYKRLHNERCV